MNKKLLQLISGTIALTSLLAYTLVHTGGLLALYIDPDIVAYVSAFGIEMSIVSLSIRIGELKRSKQDIRFFLFVLVATVTVSAVANLAEGFYSRMGQHLTVDTLGLLDPVQAIVLVSATGLISLIVMALAEIVGTDIGETIQAQVKQAKTQDSQLDKPKPPADKSKPKIEARRQQIARMMDEGMEKPDIAQALGVSEKTIHRDINVLNGADK